MINDWGLLQRMQDKYLSALALILSIRSPSRSNRFSESCRTSKFEAGSRPKRLFVYAGHTRKYLALFRFFVAPVATIGSVARRCRQGFAATELDVDSWASLCNPAHPFFSMPWPSIQTLGQIFVTLSSATLLLFAAPAFAKLSTAWDSAQEKAQDRLAVALALEPPMIAERRGSTQVFEVEEWQYAKHYASLGFVKAHPAYTIKWTILLDKGLSENE
jgi:hypothetical protein